MKRPQARIWQFNTPALDESFALAAELGVSLLVAQLLINRGLKTAAEAHTYLYPKFGHLHDAFEMADMAKAIERINRAIKRGENICVYGDYDTDGTTATALLLNAFRHIDVPVEYYIPNRFDDGYGLSEKT
ncbi:single-stranded-DNA-specific exonuclease RecJ, partial [Candidatus Poribacteria bacterium]